MKNDDMHEWLVKTILTYFFFWLIGFPHDVETIMVALKAGRVRCHMVSRIGWISWSQWGRSFGFRLSSLRFPGIHFTHAWFAAYFCSQFPFESWGRKKGSEMLRISQQIPSQISNLPSSVVITWPRLPSPWEIRLFLVDLNEPHVVAGFDKLHP